MLAAVFVVTGLGIVGLVSSIRAGDGVGIGVSSGLLAVVPAIFVCQSALAAWERRKYDKVPGHNVWNMKGSIYSPESMAKMLNKFKQLAVDLELATPKQIEEAFQEPILCEWLPKEDGRTGGKVVVDGKIRMRERGPDQLGATSAPHELCHQMIGRLTGDFDHNHSEKGGAWNERHDLLIETMRTMKF